MIDYFDIKELVDPLIFEHIGGRSWNLFDPDALDALLSIRLQFGPTYINTWSTNKNGYKESGLRRWNTETGARNSPHKYGKAFDCKFKNIDVKDAYNYIIKNPKKFPKIRRLEDISATPTWMHFDTNETGKSGIYTFKP